MSPSLGQRLKHAREKQGLTLADVAHQTRVQAQRLRDLEEDNYTAFGSLTYARSFLQTYAAHVGVDAHAVTELMPPQSLGGAGDYRYLTQSYGPWVPDRPDGSLMQQPARRVQTPRSVALVVAAIAGLLFLIGGVVVGAVWLGNGKLAAAKAAEAASVAPPDIPAGDFNGSHAEVRAAVPIVAKESGPSPEQLAAPSPLEVPVRKALRVEDDPPAKKQRR